MSLNKPTPVQKKREISTVDTILLSTLLNKELSCEGRVFEVEIAYIPQNDFWQVHVKHFKNTHMRVVPELLAKHEQVKVLAEELADKLRNVMAAKAKAMLKEPKPKTKVEEANK